MSEPNRATPFPLIRRLSRPATAALLRLPLSANMITTASLAAGLAAAGVLLVPTGGGVTPGVWAGLWLSIAYVLDNCDGEVARARNQTSTFGRHYDDFVDWAVHAAFFAALGLAQQAATGSALWSWMGGLAALGCTINYGLGILMAGRDPDAAAVKADGGARPATPAQWLIFGFRELARADFCFLVLLLGVFGQQWLLLPAGAVGAQIYWLMQFSRAARRFHT